MNRPLTEAFAVNALGARNLALVARDIDSVLIHVSTDYVFDGCKGSPYDEKDRTETLERLRQHEISR